MDELGSMNKEQLKEQALKRQLPVSGTNEELIERIRQWDLDHEDDPLGDDHDAGPDERATVDGETAKPTSFVTMFPCAGELSTGMHHDYCERTIGRAQEAGHQTRGVASRIDFTVKEGKRYAVYEVHLAREHAGRRY